MLQEALFKRSESDRLCPHFIFAGVEAYAFH